MKKNIIRRIILIILLFMSGLIYSQTEIDYYNKGIELYKSEKYTEAILNFTKAIALESTDADFYTARGNAYFMLEDYVNALFDYNKALSINLNDIITLYNRGNIYQIQKDNSLAIDDYTKVILIDPQYWEAYNNRGQLFTELGELDKAMDDFTTAINIYSSDPAALNPVYPGKDQQSPQSPPPDPRSYSPSPPHDRDRRSQSNLPGFCPILPHTRLPPGSISPPPIPPPLSAKIHASSLSLALHSAFSS